jgi:hypothetical protein
MVCESWWAPDESVSHGFEKGKVGRSAKLYKRAPMCQFFQRTWNRSHLFSMEDSKNSVASRRQRQPPLKTTFTSVLQMKSSSTCLIPASLYEGPIFYFYVEFPSISSKHLSCYVSFIHMMICSIMFTVFLCLV